MKIEITHQLPFLFDAMLNQNVRPIFAIFFPSFLIVQNREWVYWTISCYAYTIKIDWFWASFKMLNLTRLGLWLLVGRIIFKFIINLGLYIPPIKHVAEAINLVSVNKWLKHTFDTSYIILLLYPPYPPAFGSKGVILWVVLYFPCSHFTE